MIQARNIKASTITGTEIDFTTFTATGSNDNTIALNNVHKTVCSLTIPSDGDYLIDGVVRANATGSSSVTRGFWNKFTTSGTGTFAHDVEMGYAMNAQPGTVGAIATVSVKNILSNAKAGDIVNLQSRTNLSTSDITAYVGVISAIRIG